MKLTTKLLYTAMIGCAALLLVPRAKAATQADKSFLATASQANVDEIKLSQLAEQKASDPQVKAFAHRMVVDHTALGARMKPFAQAWGLPPVNSMDAEHQAEWDKLNGMSGAAFDKEYMAAMLKDHHDAANLFRQEVMTTTDVKFRPAVLHGEHVVDEHLMTAERLSKKLNP